MMSFLKEKAPQALSLLNGLAVMAVLLVLSSNVLDISWSLRRSRRCREDLGVRIFTEFGHVPRETRSRLAVYPAGRNILAGEEATTMTGLTLG